MAGFAMCAACRRRVRRPRRPPVPRPADRLPGVRPAAACSRTATGAPIATGDAACAAPQRLRAGQIVAVKGLGGYHLACSTRERRAGGGGAAAAEAPR